MDFVVPQAYQVGRDDDQVDDLQDVVYQDLIQIMIDDPTTVGPCTHLLWIAHNLERIAERATNIAERAVFAATGTMPSIDISTY